MEWILNISILAVIAFLAFQDWKENKVYAILFPLLGFLGIGKIFLTGFDTATQTAITANLLFVVILAAMMFLYLRFRFKINPFKNDSFLGWGDWAFFATTTLLITNNQFILVFMGSLISALIIAILLRRRNGIPLLTYMGIPFALFYTFNLFIVW